MATHISVLVRNVELDAGAAVFDFAIMSIFTGLQPASIMQPEEGILLAQLQLGQPAFSPAHDGVIVATPIMSDPSAANSGEAGWARIYHADGVTPLMDGACASAAGGNAAEIILAARTIIKGSVVTCQSLMIALPE